MHKTNTNLTVACKCIDKELYGAKYQQLSWGAKNTVLGLDNANISLHHADRKAVNEYMAKRNKIINLIADYDTNNNQQISEAEINLRRSIECNVIAKLKGHRQPPLAKITINDALTNKLMISELSR